MKRERSFLPRQRRRDILAVTEEMFPIKTERGTVMMSAYEIVLRKICKKVFDGHGPSMKVIAAVQDIVTGRHSADSGDVWANSFRHSCLLAKLAEHALDIVPANRRHKGIDIAASAGTIIHVI